ncbi:CYTH domain-containing protein [Vibrio breoganii]
MIEIERKWLCETSNIPIEEFVQATSITQGYLNSDPHKTIRVRTATNQGSTKATLTIKGKSSQSGLSRMEVEKDLTEEEGAELIALCNDLLISKTRYLYYFGSHTFEIDVFIGKHEGLIIAELELSSEDQEFIVPKWFGNEVTGNQNYYNLQLALN